jgi:hypothetical protein
MREALEMIPAEQKVEYTEAMRRAPRLVEIESDFERCVSVNLLISCLSCFNCRMIVVLNPPANDLSPPSVPKRYLKFEEFNPWEAARKVVDYWKVRVELFGEDRAYLPLTLTGDGALTEGDMEVFRTGVFMILPKTVHGKPTLFHDRSRYESQQLVCLSTPQLVCLSTPPAYRHCL